MKTPIFECIVFFLFLTACNDDYIVMIPTETANERFEQSVNCGKSNILKTIKTEQDFYTVLSVADCHIGTTKNLESFFRFLPVDNQAAVVLNGDITQGHTENYDDLDSCIASFDIPNLFLVAGNHDIYFNGWEEFQQRYQTSTYYFEVKTPVATDLFICLDSSSGTHGDKQLNWLKDLLKTKRKIYRHCIVFTHNNFFREHHTPSTNPFVEEIHELVKLFTEYNVEMVITGHDHHRAENVFGITNYIQLDAIHDNADQASYLKIIISGGDIKHTFIDI